MLMFGKIAALLAVCSIIGAILRSTYFQGKFKRIKPYGQLVEVYDGQMHVYSMGQGAKTIILLPGMGTVLPSVDFAPLMRKLSENYTVVCVEYFGVGFSSGTSRPRTCANYVEELRAALKQAGFNAPYVLMPHSISSVYSEYYAGKYPQEVEAVISLDGTSTAYYQAMPAFVQRILPIIKFQQAIGLTALLAALTVRKKSLRASGYTEKEVDDLITFAGFSINDTLLEQIANSAEFIKQVMDLPFPQAIPYLKVISRKTYETPNSQLKSAKMTPQEYQQRHLARIGAPAKSVILDGTHFIYQNNAERIAELTDNFLQ